MARSRHVHEVLHRRAAAEEQFLQGAFLAPVPRGGQVRVRVAGVVCRLQVEPADFEGWGIFQPTLPRTARLLCPANLAERQRYLELFPRLRLILPALLLVICGAGALGSHLADNLARQGFASLKVLDRDRVAGKKYPVRVHGRHGVAAQHWRTRDGDAEGQAAGGHAREVCCSRKTVKELPGSRV